MLYEPEGTIVFTGDDLKEKLFETIATQIEILTNLNYECLVYHEDCDIYVLQYAQRDFNMGACSFKLVTPEEYEDLQYQRTGVSDEEE